MEGIYFLKGEWLFIYKFYVILGYNDKCSPLFSAHIKISRWTAWRAKYRLLLVLVWEKARDAHKCFANLSIIFACIARNYCIRCRSTDCRICRNSFCKRACIVVPVPKCVHTDYAAQSVSVALYGLLRLCMPFHFVCVCSECGNVSRLW